MGIVFGAIFVCFSIVILLCVFIRIFLGVLILGPISPCVFGCNFGVNVAYLLMEFWFGVWFFSSSSRRLKVMFWVHFCWVWVVGAYPVFLSGISKRSQYLSTISATLQEGAHLFLPQIFGQTHDSLWSRASRAVASGTFPSCCKNRRCLSSNCAGSRLSKPPAVRAQAAVRAGRMSPSPISS